MFKNLRIQNFQSHVDTQIEFKDGVNIIVGPSDTGKSAIIRALRKLVRDDPLGKDFINNKATECTISLTLENKNNNIYTVVRKITPSKNLYYLDDHEFGGFGREIPQEIQNILEMFLVELENSESIDLHFVDQHDAPFIISKGSAGTRSKLLGRIGGLHILDKGIVNLNKDIRTNKFQLKEKINTKTQLKQKIQTLPDIKRLEILLKRLTDDINEIEQRQQLVETLEKKSNMLNEIVQQGKTLKSKLDTLSELNFDFVKLQQQIYQINKFEQLQFQITDLTSKISQIRVPISVDVDFSELTQKFQILCRLQQLNEAYLQFKQNNFKIEQQLTQIKSNIEIVENEWRNTLRGMKICPICKQSTLNC